jgi:hypothetical protein
MTNYDQLLTRLRALSHGGSGNINEVCRLAADAIEDLRAVSPAGEPVAWRPIEMAPKDGTEIILLIHGRAVSARWLDNERGYSGDGWLTLESREGFYHNDLAKGWIPLPLTGENGK